MENRKNVFLFWPAMPSKERLLPKIEKLLYPPNGSRPFIGEGGLVENFEEECSKKFGLDYVLFTNSGTSALDLALLGAGVKANDEVITTPLTCTATNLPIIGRQAKPVFADVQYETGNIDPKDIAKKITDKTKAIMIVHWGGYPCDMDEIESIANSHGIPVISDAAHGIGSTYHEKPISNFTKYTMFSLQSIKQMTTIDGGLLAIRMENSPRELVELSKQPKIAKTLRQYFGNQLSKYFEKDVSNIEEISNKAGGKIIATNSLKTKLPKDFFLNEIYNQIQSNIGIDGIPVDTITNEKFSFYMNQWNYNDFAKFWGDWQGAESVKRMRWFGIGRDERSPAPGKGYFAYPTTEPGGKYAPHNLSALIGLESLSELDAWQDRRAQIAKIYDEELKKVQGINPFEKKTDRVSGNWLYNIHIKRRGDFVNKMQERGIECSIVHERNDYLPIFRKYSSKLNNLNKINEDRVCIPLHQHMDDEDVGYVISSIKKGW